MSKHKLLTSWLGAIESHAAIVPLEDLWRGQWLIQVISTVNDLADCILLALSDNDDYIMKLQNKNTWEGAQFIFTWPTPSNAIIICLPDSADGCDIARMR